jgi:hypothetical protein
VAATIDPIRLRDTIDVLREGIQILSPEWRYLYLNDAAARHGRSTREALLGKTMLECYPGIEATHDTVDQLRCFSRQEPERAPDREGAFVEVADDGPGMPADAERHAFEPFFTTKEDGKPAHVGVGRQRRRTCSDTMAFDPWLVCSLSSSRCR